MTDRAPPQCPPDRSENLGSPKSLSTRFTLQTRLWSEQKVVKIVLIEFPLDVLMQQTEAECRKHVSIQPCLWVQNLPAEIWKKVYHKVLLKVKKKMPENEVDLAFLWFSSLTFLKWRWKIVGLLVVCFLQTQKKLKLKHKVSTSIRQS